MSDEKADQAGPNSGPSQRLQGLSTRGGPGGLRGGRFLPNAVGRRSKEERESSAPALKPHIPAEHETNKHGNRGKPDRRKQRQLGTRAEAAGPLAAPTIAANASTARMARPTGSTGGSETSYRSRGGPIVKSEPESALSASVASDVRIDMSLAAPRDSFIPLRMPTSIASAKTEASDSAAGQKEPEDVPSQAPAINEAPADAEAALKQAEIEGDLLEMNEGDLFLVQLPNLNLAAGKAPSTSILHAPNADPVKPAEVKVKDETVENGEADVPPEHENDAAQADVSMEESKDEPVVGAAGRLGTLRRHASGKHTMVIGGAVYEVIKGTHGSSLEELVVMNEATHRSYPLGGVKSRMLMIPDLDSLNIR